MGMLCSIPRGDVTSSVNHLRAEATHRRGRRRTANPTHARPQGKRPTQPPPRRSEAGPVSPEERRACSQLTAMAAYSELKLSISEFQQMRIADLAISEYHHPMHDLPPHESPQPVGAAGFPSAPGVQAPWPPGPTMHTYPPSRWPTIVALAIALVAVAVAIVGWFHPRPPANPSPVPPAPAFTAQQIADAKANVCAANELVHEAVSINTNRQDPVPGDEIGRIAVAAHARLALFDGGEYLLNRINTEPATPTDLANNVRTLANTLQQLAVNSLADAPNSTKDPLRKAVDATFAKIDGLCK